LTPWFAIESREVSKRDYEAFLDANPDPALQPSACAWNSSFVPTDEWPPAADTDHPVVFVDWCDARAYCDWAGRRLCGRIGGGSNDFADYANPYQSEWMWSCSEEGTRTFAWGSTYNGSACNGLDYGAGSTLPVGSLSTCEGGLPGLFDMGGNVWEWEDSCQADSGAGDLCRRRGGSAWSDESLISCNIGGYDTRDTVFKYVGIRCCDDL
jgi:formylglycine-generating enzyme required for sulfatase activity